MWNGIFIIAAVLVVVAIIGAGVMIFNAFRTRPRRVG